MLRLATSVVCLLALLLGLGVFSPMAAQSIKSQQSTSFDLSSWWDDPVNWQQQFVPAYRPFWEDSINWTSNYGPAFRDVIEKPSQMLACSNQFALCFHSGAEPYPCTLSPDGHSANCRCTVANSVNFTLITAILNYPIYKQTVQQCKSDGSMCHGVGTATVCNYLPDGKLIPGADVISTYDPDTQTTIQKALTSSGGQPVTTCPKAPYAACMTAPCTLNSDGSANCKCPVFYGRFMLTGRNATCSLGGNLVPSSSYIPALDPMPLQ